MAGISMPNRRSLRPFGVVWVGDVLSVIVCLVPADGVEQEGSVSGPPVLQGRAIDDVAGQLLNEIGHEGVECFRIIPVGETIALQGAGGLALR